MPLNRADFESGNFKKRRNERENHPALKFLAAHPAQAFTIKEVSKQIKMKQDTVRSMFGQLIKDNLILHKAPYWAIRIKRKR